MVTSFLTLTIVSPLFNMDVLDSVKPLAYCFKLSRAEILFFNHHISIALSNRGTVSVKMLIYIRFLAQSLLKTFLNADIYNFCARCMTLS